MTPLTGTTDPIQAIYSVLLQQSAVQTALQFITEDSEHVLADQVHATEIPAPSFLEADRAAFFMNRFEELGLQDVHTDAEGNVCGIRPGLLKESAPTLLVCAHLDTVFPAGTDVTVSVLDGKLYAPGISDDGRGLAATLGLIRALDAAGIQTNGDIVFAATVGEEGIGDLRGVKSIFAPLHSANDQDSYRGAASKLPDGFISIEPGNPSQITYLATGSHRYKVTYLGPGGHSFGAFGTPSAIHALGRAIAKIGSIRVPQDPKTTYTVGGIQGGTSVNTIAASASMMIDMRSNSMTELLLLEEQVLTIVKQAAEEENQFWNEESIHVQVELIGDRPAGSQSPDSVIVKTAKSALLAIGREPVLEQALSTDANVPISLGIPALTLGGGGTPGAIHTLGEYFDPTDAHLGVQFILLTILGLVGIAGVCDPLLSPRNQATAQ